MFKKLGLYYQTIKHLKPIQIGHRLWYLLRDRISKLTGHSSPLSISKQHTPLDLIVGLPSSVSLSEGTFTFLNQSHTFEESIDWNFGKYGKLWAYKLNYFDYLNQEDIGKEDGLKLIGEFINQVETNSEGLEPYPISLRGINWIKFLVKHEIKEPEIDASLYAQYQILYNNIEYHLLGNHLLENGCSLLFGAYYFGDQELCETAEQILDEQIEEQILGDGGHFERSTMYHCILLERLMDCYNLMTNNDHFKSADLEQKLKEKLELMLGWVDGMRVDGRPTTDDSRAPSAPHQLPLLNDAAKGISSSPVDLFSYAERLNLEPEKKELSESGYRKYSTSVFDIICDVGDVGPDYQPGHAHSDTLSFVMYYKCKPVIIDPGISTYQSNRRRQLERSTAFHNTIQLEDKEQSEIWNAFRVGRRAKITDIQEKRNAKSDIKLCGTHDGYNKWGVKHRRCWKIDKDQITVRDDMNGAGERNCYFHLHFHPDWSDKIRINENTVQLNNITITFDELEDIERQVYHCPDGYNQYIKGSKIVVLFKRQMTANITLTQ